MKRSSATAVNCVSLSEKLNCDERETWVTDMETINTDESTS